MVKDEVIIKFQIIIKNFLVRLKRKCNNKMVISLSDQNPLRRILMELDASSSRMLFRPHK